MVATVKYPCCGDILVSRCSEIDSITPIGRDLLQRAIGEAQPAKGFPGSYLGLLRRESTYLCRIQDLVY
jgi:hypothetical protein